MYLHEPGEDADSYTREEMVTGKHQAIEKADLKSTSSALGGASGPISSVGTHPGPTTLAASISNALLANTIGSGSGVLNLTNAMRGASLKSYISPPCLIKRRTWTHNDDREDSPSLHGTRNAWKPIPQASTSINLNADDWPTAGTSFTLIVMAGDLNRTK